MLSFSSKAYILCRNPKKCLITLAPKEWRARVRKSRLPLSCGVLGLYREQFDISWATGHHATYKLSWHLAVSRVSVFTLWILLLLWKSQLKMPAQHKCSSPASTKLTFRCRNFLLNFSTPVFKMWIIQEPKKVALWNKWLFEEEKTESVQHV